MKIRWKSVGGVLILAGLAVAGGLRIRDAYQKKNQAQAPRGGGGVRVVSVGVDSSRMGAVREEVLVTAALKPKEQVDVTAKATGRVEKILFHVGDAVKKGDLIAVLEDDELQQQVKRSEASQSVARAASAQREAELNNSKSDLARAETLLKEGLISRQDYETRRTAFQVVQAQLQLASAQEEQARAELNELKIRLEQTKVVAPMAGHIAKRNVDEGALVNPTTPIVNLVNLATMVAMANVPERDVAKLRVGNAALVEVDAFGSHKFNGRVVRIGPVLDAATRSALVEIEIPNANLGLRAEMFARVTVDLASTRQAVLIPREALVYRGQQPGVYLVKNDRPVFQPVETGLTQGNEVEVTSSLAAGALVITRGATMLTEGDQIRVSGKGRGRDTSVVGPDSPVERQAPQPARKAEVLGVGSPAKE